MYKKRQVRRYRKKSSRYTSYILKQLSMLKHILYQRLMFGIRQVSDFGTSNGQLFLQMDQTTDNVLPLHIFPLCNIINNSTTPVGGYELKDNGYDFGSLGNIEVLGTDGNTIQINDNMTLDKVIWNYIDIRMLLYGQADRRSDYRILLLQVSDKDLQIERDPVTTDTEEQEHRKTLFHHLVRPFISNPIMRHEHILGDTRKKIKILWDKKYTIRETLSTENREKHKQVKIFRKINKVVDFRSTPQGDTPVIDPDTVVYHNNDSGVQTYPEHRDQIYLVVIGSGYDDDDVCSYDISVKSVFTTLGEHTQS